MADDKEKDSTEEEGAEAGTGKKKKLLIIGGAVVLLLLLAGGAAFFFLGGNAEEDADAEAVPAEEVKLPAQYQDLGEPFIANLDENGRSRYMQLAVSVMSRNPEAIAALDQHAPLIRSKLTMLFGSQDFAMMRTAGGKDALQQQVRDTIQQVLTQESDDPADAPQVEQVFFTQFVLQ